MDNDEDLNAINTILEFQKKAPELISQIDLILKPYIHSFRLSILTGLIVDNYMNMNLPKEKRHRVKQAVINALAEADSWMDENLDDSTSGRKID